MARHKISWIGALVFACLCCSHPSPYVDTTGSNYPSAIARIILSKCATSGCHNQLSFKNAGGLDLSTWNGLIRGSATGAVVIPYRPDFSPLCFFTNTFPDLGIALQPSMPYNAAPLSRGEYAVLRDWIAAGAPSADGRVPFSDAPGRSKYYVANRLCDVVTVIDAASKIQMRYVDAGNGSDARYPACIHSSPDRKFWYVSFFSPCSTIQQFDAATDIKTTDLHPGTGIWTSFAIADDSRTGWFVDNSSPGKIVYMDLVTGAVLSTYSFGNNFRYPTGIAYSSRLHKLYAGTSSGNFVYVVNIKDPLSPEIRELPIDGGKMVSYQSSMNAVDLAVDTVSDNCFVACEGSGEIAVVDMNNNSVVRRVSLPAAPAMMAWSGAKRKLFVSCPDDEVSFPGNRGAVHVVDVSSGAVVCKVNTGYQPYGLAVDERTQAVLVVNANISSAGHASHHSSGCGKQDGNVTFIDLNTLDLVPEKLLEVAVFPYGRLCVSSV